MGQALFKWKKKKKIENNDKTCSGDFYSKFNIIQEDSNNQCFIKIHLIFFFVNVLQKKQTNTKILPISIKLEWTEYKNIN